jgi:protein-S-isoprenylcysteine O-methyltransferase Ste14
VARWDEVADAGSINFDFMGPLHRAINLIVALILTAIGVGGVVYFYFIDTTWPLWITIVASIVGASGLYWLWEEYVNVGQQPWD